MPSPFKRASVRRNLSFPSYAKPSYTFHFLVHLLCIGRNSFHIAHIKIPLFQGRLYSFLLLLLSPQVSHFYFSQEVFLKFEPK